jgi:hypothetical protein
MRSDRTASILLSWVCGAAALAEPIDGPLPGHQRSLDVPRIHLAIEREGRVPARLPGEPPVIDGELDDAAWEIASVSSGFWVSAQDRSPTDRTEVLVLSDDNYLYFGFRLFDRDPDGIRSTTAVRDVGLGYDDSITVELDTFLNRRDISEFSLNPAGTQSDKIAGGRSSKVEWKGDWQGAAKRTPYGWSAEFAIPFSILNYQQDDTRFGVNFRRYQSRTKEISYWADITPQGLAEEMGILEGLELRTVSETRPWTLMPFALVGKNVPDKRGEIQDTLGTAGIDMRYQPRQDLTGMISVNPDFSQVEQAVTDISFSYSEKAVAENRPFFVEGADYFGTEREYFYSNRVADFDVGGKGFGRIGQMKYGVLLTKAPDDRTDFVARALYELDDTNSANISVVGTQQQEFDNVLALGQFRGRRPSGLNYSLDAAMTSTDNVSDADAPEGKGNHFKGSIGWKSDYWSADLSGDKYDVNYFPANALLSSDLPGTKGTSAKAGYHKERLGPVWRTIDGYVGAYYRETDARQLQARKWYAGGSLEFNNDVRAGIYIEEGPYRPVTDTAGVFEEEVNQDRYYSATLDFNTRSNRYSGGIQYDWGDLGGGAYEYLAGYGWWRPINSVYLSLSAEREESFGKSDQLVFVSSWDINPEHSLGGRYISNEDGNYYRFAYGHRARRGIDIFAVYDKQPFQDALYSIKWVYTFKF